MLAPILKLFGVPKRQGSLGQKAPKIAQKSPSAPQGRPKASRDPPGGLQGTILASFWAPRSSFSSLSKRPFRSLRAPHHTIENTVRNHFPKDPLRPLRDRCAQHRRLSGRFGAAGPLEIRPLSLQAQEAAVERSECSFRKHCDKHSFGEAQRLP